MSTSHNQSHNKNEYMRKTQGYFRDEELKALRDAAVRSNRSVADLIREAIRRTWLPRARPEGPVALWDGESTATSVDHDRIFDKP